MSLPWRWTELLGAISRDFFSQQREVLGQHFPGLLDEDRVIWAVSPLWLLFIQAESFKVVVI